MEWITPKTDWSEHYNEDGEFIGDFFNYTDYNRIKNNLLCLRELAAEFVYGVPRVTVGVDKREIDDDNPDPDNDWFYADEFNLIEDGLQAIYDAVPHVEIDGKQTFMDNGAFIDANELNRIESAQLRLYEILMASIAGKLRLAFILGARPYEIRI